MPKQHTTPCSTCPFGRKVDPGALGGSKPGVYIGQCEAGFRVPCHSAIDYEDPEWNSKARGLETPQCAGLATFRANLSIPGLPGRVANLSLPANHAAVFSSYVEFLAHHAQCDLKLAQEYLEWIPPEACAKQVMEAPGVSVTVVLR